MGWAGLVVVVQADVKTYEGDGYGVDIGPLTVGDFHGVLNTAKTFLWNGPMGILEVPRYALGQSTLVRK
jgi:phosphoglycerate kinase